jgi:hypothetical protein
VILLLNPEVSSGYYTNALARPTQIVFFIERLASEMSADVPLKLGMLIKAINLAAKRAS